MAKRYYLLFLIVSLLWAHTLRAQEQPSSDRNTLFEGKAITYTKQGYEYLNNRDYLNAIDYFTRALTLYPNHTPAQQGLIEAENALGGTSGNKNTPLSAANQPAAPLLVNKYLSSANNALNKNDLIEALSLASRALALDPSNADATRITTMIKAALQKETEALETRVAALQEELTTTQKRLTETVQETLWDSTDPEAPQAQPPSPEIKARIDSLSDTITSLQMEATGLREDNARLREALTVAQASVDEMKRFRDAARETERNLASFDDEKTALVEGYEQRLAQAQAKSQQEIETLHSQIALTEKNMTALRDENRLLKGALEEAKHENRELSQEVTALGQDNKSLVANFQRESEQLRGQIVSLEKSVTSLQTEKASLQESLRTKQEALRENAQQLTAVSRENNQLLEARKKEALRLNDTIASLEDDSALAQAKIVELGTALANEQASGARLAQEVARITQEKEEGIAKRKHLVNETKSLRLSLERAQNETRELQRKLAASNEERKKELDSLNDLFTAEKQELIKNYQEQSQATRDENAHLKKELSQQDSFFQKQLTEVTETARAQETTMQKSLSSLQEQIASLSREKDALAAELAKTKKFYKMEARQELQAAHRQEVKRLTTALDEEKKEFLAQYKEKLKAVEEILASFKQRMNVLSQEESEVQTYFGY